MSVFKKITAIAAAGIMALSMTATASASGECVRHITVYNEVGTTHDVYAGSHTYISEIRIDKYGNETEIKSTCYMRSIGKKYEYQCVKCGIVTSSGEKNRITHSSCGK